MLYLAIASFVVALSFVLYGVSCYRYNISSYRPVAHIPFYFIGGFFLFISLITHLLGKI
jgi:hypothetical protein